MPALKASCVSFSVKNSRFPYLAGRSKGVTLRLVQYPCRSGWPSGKRGMVHAWVLAALVSGPAEVFSRVLVAPPDDWAARKDGAHNEAAMSNVRALDETQRRFIRSSSREFLIRDSEFAVGSGYRQYIQYITTTNVTRAS